MFALLHFLVLAAAFTLVFSWTMARFDTGAPATIMETVLDGVVSVLTVPMAWLRNVPFDQDTVDMLQWPLIVLNSLLWGYGLEYLYSRLRRQTV
jgi:hypothetical protein